MDTVILLLLIVILCMDVAFHSACNINCHVSVENIMFQSLKWLSLANSHKPLGHRGRRARGLLLDQALFANLQEHLRLFPHPFQRLKQARLCKNARPFLLYIIRKTFGVLYIGFPKCKEILTRFQGKNGRLFRRFTVQ